MKYDEYLEERKNLEKQLDQLEVKASISGPEFLIVEKKYGQHSEIILTARYTTANDPSCRINEEHLKDLAVGEYYLVNTQICYVRVK